MKEYVSRFIEFVATILLIVFTAWGLQYISKFANLNLDIFFIVLAIGVFLLMRIETSFLSLFSVLANIASNTRESVAEQGEINQNIKQLNYQLEDLNSKVEVLEEKISSNSINNLSEINSQLTLIAKKLAQIAILIEDQNTKLGNNNV